MLWCAIRIAEFMYSAYPWLFRLLYQLIFLVYLFFALNGVFSKCVRSL